MKRVFTVFSVIALIGLLFIDNSIAQDSKDAKDNKKASAASSLYVISAKAGAVNFVSGKVAVDKKDAKSGYLIKGDTVEVGEKVRTGSEGRAEILLNPGSFVRLAENTEFEFTTTSLDDLQVKLDGGSAIFEVIADREFNVAVNTPKSRFYLIKSGIYRVDVLSDGFGKLSVWKGQAQIGDKNATVVKGGRTAAFINGQASVQKFDRDDKGELELWSKDRAKELAKVNARLRGREMNRSLISTFSQNGSGNLNGYGLWVFDPFSRSHCFLPFGNGWSSPYGYGFNISIWNYATPTYNLNQTNPNFGNAANQQPGSSFPSQNNGASSPINSSAGSSGSNPSIGRPANPGINSGIDRSSPIRSKASPIDQ